MENTEKTVLEALQEKDFDYFKKRFEEEPEFRNKVLGYLGLTVAGVVFIGTPWGRRILQSIWWRIQPHAYWLLPEIMEKIQRKTSAPKKLKELPEKGVCTIRINREQQIPTKAFSILRKLYKKGWLAENPGNSEVMFHHISFVSLLDVEKTSEKDLQILFSLEVLYTN